MCGIAGIVALSGSAVDSVSLDRLTDALAHRGPDGRGTFLGGNVGLGHRRLSIIDLSDAAAQPMRSEDGDVVLSFNGEIYNFLEKRRELEAKGYRFHSRSDTEVLLKLYQEYGKDCVLHLRGMFAFAVYDRKRGELMLARDRVGKKPIKYFHESGVFAFASELKALRVLSQCPREVDAEAIHHFLTMMYLPSPLTGFRGIKKLPAAHRLILDVRTGAQRLERYWELSYETDHQKPVAAWKEEILAVFDESVRLRLVADVPVGAFLSGGIDSAAVVAFMSRHSDRPVKTFSIGTAHDSHNELPDAARIAARFGTDHHPISLEADIVHLLPQLVHAYEEPYADPSSIPTFLIARETRKDVTVALNGDGGDENFAGYVRYPILLFSERWRRLPVHPPMRLGTAAFHRLRGDTLSYRSRRFQHTVHLPLPQRYLQYLSFFTEEEKRSLYRPGFADRLGRTDDWYADRTAPARARAHDLLHKAMSMDIDTYLADDLLPKVDLGTMASALEARSPFLDQELLELTARLPARYQLRGRSKKWILKEALRGILPEETLRGKKRGFRLPLDAWFRAELRGVVRDRLLSSRQPLFASIFDRSRLEAFLDAYEGGRVDYSDHVWALLWLEEWMRQYT